VRAVWACWGTSEEASGLPACVIPTGPARRKLHEKALVFIGIHVLAVGLGFAAGIYALPILTAPTNPSQGEMAAQAGSALFTGQFRRDLKDSDALHWGEGRVSVGAQVVSLQGRLAPRPDYQLYLWPEFIETEAEFLRLKGQRLRVGAVKTFQGFVVSLRAGADPARYQAVVIWCEDLGSSSLLHATANLDPAPGQARHRAFSRRARPTAERAASTSP